MILRDDRPAIEVRDNINIDIYFGNVKGLFEEAYIGGVPAAVREKYFYSLSCFFFIISALLQLCMILVKHRVNTTKKWPRHVFIILYFSASRYNIVLPPLRGCVSNVQVDFTASFAEEVGIVRGCPNLLVVRHFRWISWWCLCIRRKFIWTVSGCLFSGFPRGYF